MRFRTEQVTSHRKFRMFWSQMVLQHWCFALFLLCSPVPHHARPVDDPSSRTRRSVTHTQLMHDKGRALQDFKRRMWLQELLDEVHTADIRELPVRTTSTGGGDSRGVGLGQAVVSPSSTSSTLHPKPPGGTKNLPETFKLEDEEGTNLPQETNKSTSHKDGGSMTKMPGKKKKKGRSGKRRDGEKKKRRARSLVWLKKVGSGLHLEWSSLLGVL
ncbi:parathyroid hormone-like hormone a isoform X1 [Takifugu rubripes]|nr:parathyroid hormone-related protein isoform X1 [Takifugu rubripes]|eukprot:XP_011616597.1 PREDICTED: parathyroid hormone-related protein-like [Takifugu rubripes]